MPRMRQVSSLWGTSLDVLDQARGLSYEKCVGLWRGAITNANPLPLEGHTTACERLQDSKLKLGISPTLLGGYPAITDNNEPYSQAWLP